MKPRHSTAPLGFPGKVTTSESSTTAASPRDRMALGVISKLLRRMISPKPGTSQRMIERIEAELMDLRLGGEG